MTTDPPKPRRFPRYSLRTLMLVVTVFCIWVGVTTKRARDQRQAVEVILEMGGRIFYEHQVEYLPHLQRTQNVYVPMQFFYMTIGFTGERPKSPEWLRRLIGDEYFFGVFAVALDGSKRIDDRSLVEIKRLPELKWLTLYRTRVTDAGVEHLRELPNLVFLDIRHTLITDEGIKKLQQALPNCDITH